jgi:hypothetical protein
MIRILCRYRLLKRCRCAYVMHVFYFYPFFGFFTTNQVVPIFFIIKGVNVKHRTSVFIDVPGTVPTFVFPNVVIIMIFEIVWKLLGIGPNV